MDSLDVVALTRRLVDVDSTTGREAEVGTWLAGYLRAGTIVPADVLEEGLGHQGRGGYLNPHRSLRSPGG